MDLENISKHIIFIIFVSVFLNGYGQISPGDLSKSHSELEGLSNCTKCHELGKKVTNKKCLNCHDEINDLLRMNRGYHANSNVAKKDCISCHSDHHGSNFEIIRLDEDSFDHNLAGYTLEGKHEIIDCRKCHEPDNIENDIIKKRNNTFLGLVDDCISCHDDYHQETIESKDCLSCHDMEAFEPASGFDHNETDYKLIGKHKKIDCKECHAKTIKNGKEFQEFAISEFSDCKSCHDDVHKNQIKGSCNQCHSEESFSLFKGKGRFDHQLTGFSLKGSHKKIDCFDCHKESDDPVLVFQDKIKIDENNCVSCHTDNHEGKYGNECATCHKESSFLSLKTMDLFDHNIANYSLEGMHLKVDCKSCHTERYSNSIDFSACSNCHDDYHHKEFEKNGISPDCKECHSLENGFDYSLFSVEKHQTTEFPLIGAHVATPCFACHVSEEKWTFKDMGTACVDCHQDIHKKDLSSKYYPDNSCIVCHINDAWDIVNFDHQLTKWPLKGKHLSTTCKECHTQPPEDGLLKNIVFANTNNKCSSCHENIHDDQFAVKGITDCKKCHIPDDWFPTKFDHDKTSFPLEGRHAEIACNECHLVSVIEEKSTINYKIKKFECIDCHK